MTSQRWPIERELLLESFVESVIVWGAVVAFFGIIAATVYYYDRRYKPSKKVDKAVRKFRTKIKYVLVSGPPAVILDIMDWIITIAFCALYIYELYQDVPASLGIRIAELIIASCIFADYVRHFLAATRKLHFLYHPWWLMTLFSAINVIVPIIFGTYTPYLGFLRFFRIYTLVKYNTGHFRLTKFAMQLLKLVLTIIAAMLAVSGMLFLTENLGDPPHWTNKQDLGYYVCLYWVVVTISTVGYGDVVPKTYFGRAVIIGLIVFALYFVPKEVGKLVEILKLKPFRGKYSRKSSGHVVVIVQEPTSFRNFLTEFYHPDHSDNSLDVVLMTLEKTPELFGIVSDPIYRERVFLVTGDPLKRRDLEAVRLQEAVACFLMTPSVSGDWNTTELKMILRSISVANFKRDNDCKFKIFLQLIQAESKLHIPPEVDYVICLESLSMHMLAKSCLSPGFSTLLSNLVSSARGSEKINMDTWWKEYMYGKSLEMYTIHLKRFQGLSFMAAALQIYEEHEIILFGVQIEGKSAPVGKNLLLNPGHSYVLGEHDTGFVIAADIESAKKIAKVKWPTSHSATCAACPGTQPHPAPSSAPGDSQQLQEHPTPSLPIHSPYASNPVLHQILLEVFHNNGWKMLQETASFLIEAGVVSPNTKVVISTKPSKPKTIVDDNGVWKLSCKQSLEECTLEDEDASSLEGHIIVCGGFHGVNEFVKELRNTSQGEKSMNIKVVVMHPDPPTEAQWDRLAYFPNVYYKPGSVLRDEDWKSCRVETALSVVLIVPSSGTLDPNVVDGTTVLGLNHVESHSKCQILAAFVDGRNCKLLKKCVTAEKPKKSGKTAKRFRTRILDPERESIHYASGRIFLNSVLDFCLAQCYYNENTMPIFELLCGGTVERMKIPRELAGISYGDLVRYLVVRELMPLGLYRSREALKQTDYSYVVTSPPAELKVHEEDKVFVILPSRRNQDSTAHTTTNQHAFSRTCY